MKSNSISENNLPQWNDAVLKGNNKLLVKNEVERDTHRLKGNKEASPKYRDRPYVGSNSGEGDFSVRWSKTRQHRLAGR